MIPKMLETEVPRIVHAWIAEALKEKKFLPRPEPQVVGKGLESIQLAIDKLQKGVSATKLVVEI
jgi:hypothetical protein